MARLDGKGAPFRFDDRRVAEEARHAGAVEGGRHRQDPQVLPQGALRVEGEGQPEIGVEGALVELVEQHRADAGQFRIVEDHPGEHAFGDDLDPGAGRDLGAEPHPQAHRVADPLAQGRGHALGRPARREPPGLQQDDLFRPEPGLVEEGQRHAGGLAGARRRHEHGGDALRQGRAQGGEGGVDRERGGRHGPRGAAVRARAQPSGRSRGRPRPSRGRAAGLG
ncbi:hypothetical protein CHKEEEPN_2629 [Methylorubrum podarium]|nr:hypothetical protein CHKEEEPN_2629 [Methylorubrum podarium]